MTPPEAERADSPAPVEGPPDEGEPAEGAASRRTRAPRTKKEAKPAEVGESAAVEVSPATEVAEPAEEAQPGWETMSDAEKLDAIKDEVTKIVRGNNVDGLRSILKHFEARKASELAPEQYDAFMDAVRRHYNDGESLDEILETDLA